MSHAAVFRHEPGFYGSQEDLQVSTLDPIIVIIIIIIVVIVIFDRCWTDAAFYAVRYTGRSDRIILVVVLLILILIIILVVVLLLLILIVAVIIILIILIVVVVFILCSRTPALTHDTSGKKPAAIPEVLIYCLFNVLLDNTHTHGHHHQLGRSL
jgi:fatty acid desaturase